MTWTGHRWRQLGSHYASAEDARTSAAFRAGRRQRQALWSREGLTLHTATWHAELGWLGPAVLAAGIGVAAWLLLGS